MVGRTLAHYVIVEKIGAGGMGVVYKARDTQLERFVALKVVGDKTQSQARLMREARTASALNHSNICTVYEAGVSDGETYIAMELVEGEPLSSVIPENGLPVEVVIRFGVRIADALAHAHQRGVVHRDLKSLNVMITPEGQPKVLDFGLAKQVLQEDGESQETLTQAGVVMGTPAFMAPEILGGGPADARSDLWAMGVMLYQAVTGSLPFRGAMAIQRDEPAPLPASIPKSLAAIIQRLLAKEPKERYQRADEVRDALRALQPGSAVSRRRWFWPAAAAMAGAVALVFIQPKTRVAEPRLSDGSRRSKISEANDYYERALLFSGSAVRHDPPQVRRMLERALALDPKFAAARAHHAFTNMLRVLQGDSSDLTWLYKAEAEARQALRDDPDCSLAHSTLAGTYYLQGRKELMPVEAEKAFKGNPNDPTVKSWLLLYHWSNGDYEQGMRVANQILADSPTFWPARLNLGEMLRERGDLAGAAREQERILELDPQSRIALIALARAHMDAGELRKARDALELMRPQDRKNLRVRLCWALLLAREGKRAEALREMDSDVQAYGGNSFMGPLHVTEFYSVMGETEKALEWLEKALRMGDEREDWMRRNPMLAGVRDHPRFQQMLTSVAYRRKQRPNSTTETR